MIIPFWQMGDDSQVDTKIKDGRVNMIIGKRLEDSSIGAFSNRRL